MQQETISYNHKKVVSLYVVYEITNFHGTNNYPTLTNSLFGAAKLTKILTLTILNIFDMELDFMVMDFIHILVEELEEM